MMCLQRQRWGTTAVSMLLLTVLLSSEARKTMTSGSGSRSGNGIGYGLPYLRVEDLPGITASQGERGKDIEKKKWYSTDDKDVSFLPVDEFIPKTTGKTKQQLLQQQEKNRRRRQEEEDGADEDDSDGTDESETETGNGKYDEYNPYSVQPFVEGMSEYDEYQQAWKLLGFMIDCNTVDEDDEASHNSADGDMSEAGCARYILWAAYVDLDYQGGGIGEYQYYDRTTKSWNDTSCYYASNNGERGGENGNGKSRCAKMDCHLDTTETWSLLGFFKHRNYDDWMEQLFKHEGMCVWTDEEYAFMKSARKAWPQGCTKSGQSVTLQDAKKDSSGKVVESAVKATLYYDVKPMRSGRIGVGLYIDEQCITEYSKSSDMEYIEDLLGNFLVNGGGSHDSGDNGNYDFSGESLSESMERWNSAFDVWHTCHPCVAYDLENVKGNVYTDDDDDAGAYYNDDGNNDDGNNDDGNRIRKLGGEYNAQGDVFECYDDAGYTNVNQVRDLLSILF